MSGVPEQVDKTTTMAEDPPEDSPAVVDKDVDEEALAPTESSNEDDEEEEDPSEATAPVITDAAPSSQPMTSMSSPRTDAILAEKQAIRERRASRTEEASAGASTEFLVSTSSRDFSIEDDLEEECDEDDNDEENPPESTPGEVIVPEATVVDETIPEQVPRRPSVVEAAMHVLQEGDKVVVDKKQMRWIVALLALLIVALVAGLSVAFLTGGGGGDSSYVNVNADSPSGGTTAPTPATGTSAATTTNYNETTLAPTPYATPPLLELDLVCQDDGYVQVAGRGAQRVPDDVFRSLIQESPNQIIRRTCSTCQGDHQDIYYRRFTSLPPDSLDFLNVFLESWVDSPANLMGTDFALYSTYDDALAGTNPWLFCNYNDATVGFPRDCSPDPNAIVINQWTGSLGDVVNLHHDFAYYVECAAAVDDNA